MSITFVPGASGLGNMIARHNAAYAYSKENNLKLCAFSVAPYNPKRPGIKTYQKFFSHVELTTEHDQDVYNEPHFTYDPLPAGIKVIIGEFQSYKYFEKYRLEIRDLFRKNENNLFRQMEEYINKIKNGKDTVCIHVRRTDYLIHPEIYTILGPSYYTKCLEHFEKERIKLVVFSDDINHVKTWGMWSGYDVHFVEDIPDPMPTFFAMSVCDHFIIANSSLSLAAYYFRSNQDSKIFAPEKWFAPMGPKFDMKDLVHEECVVI